MSTDNVTSIRKRSVTRNNIIPGSSNILGITFLSGYNQQAIIQQMQDIPPYWSYTRDNVLSYTPHYDVHWANAVGLFCSQLASLGWTVEGDVPLRVKNAQELLHLVEGGQGWITGMYKWGMDYTTTDNGMFIEIVRATEGAGSKIIGLMHLDSLRCIRTGDPETPVIYYDRLGVYHELKQHEVIIIADSPSARDQWYGVGFCATSRAYKKIQLISAIERFIYEKVTGSTPKTIDFISGITDKQLRDIMASNQAERQTKGAIVYGGSVLTAFMSNDNINHVRIPFAGLPDNFDLKQERTEARLEYANALGIDPQDLEPISGSHLGTASQTNKLHDKAKTRGMEALKQALVHNLNEYVFPDKTTFAFSEKDTDEEKKQADVMTAYATFVDLLVKDGTITPDQAMQVLVDKKALPQEFLPNDQTPFMQLSDDDQPELLDDTEPETLQPVDIQGMVNRIYASKTIASETLNALKIYEEIANG